MFEDMRLNKYQQYGKPNNLYVDTSIRDFGARNLGYTSYAVGVPTDPRHRKFLGFQMRPGTIGF